MISFIPSSSGGFEGCNQSSVNSQGCHLHVPWRENHRWNILKPLGVSCVLHQNPWILPRRLLEVKRFTAEDPKMWVKKVFMRKLRINYRSFFGVLNKISLHISPKKNDNDTKEWAKRAKDEIYFSQILSHRERVVGHRWTVGAKRISNSMAWSDTATWRIIFH